MAESIQAPGGYQAVQLRVAEQYINQFGNLAKESNTLILPATLSDVGSMIRARDERDPPGHGSRKHASATQESTFAASLLVGATKLVNATVDHAKRLLPIDKELWRNYAH